MNYRGNDPGAVQYGNFINYYQFHSAEDRINLLPEHIWTTDNLENEPFLVLDIGCNSGVVTQLLYDFFQKQTKRTVYIFGVDIDPVLIERAKNSNNHENVSYQCLDIMKPNHFHEITSCLERHTRKQFDTTFCFSITMWIHLNNGDNGLKEFLRQCANISKILAIEPQPWRCYQAAVKRLRKANDTFPRFVDLQWRSNVESHIKCYMENDLGCVPVYETDPTRWKRKICIYHTHK